MKVTPRDDIMIEMTKVLTAEPAVSSIEYISVSSAHDMKELAGVDVSQGGGGAVLSCAIRIGTVRLIDNIIVGNDANNIVFNK